MRVKLGRTSRCTWSHDNEEGLNAILLVIYAAGTQDGSQRLEERRRPRGQAQRTRGAGQAARVV